MQRQVPAHYSAWCVLKQGQVIIYFFPRPLWMQALHFAKPDEHDLLKSSSWLCQLAGIVEQLLQRLVHVLSALIVKGDAEAIASPQDSLQPVNSFDHCRPIIASPAWMMQEHQSVSKLEVVRVFQFVAPDNWLPQNC